MHSYVYGLDNPQFCHNSIQDYLHVLFPPHNSKSPYPTARQPGPLWWHIKGITPPPQGCSGGEEGGGRERVHLLVCSNNAFYSFDLKQLVCTDLWNKKNKKTERFIKAARTIYQHKFYWRECFYSFLNTESQATVEIFTFSWFNPWERLDNFRFYKRTSNQIFPLMLCGLYLLGVVTFKTVRLKL